MVSSTKALVRAQPPKSPKPYDVRDDSGNESADDAYGELLQHRSDEIRDLRVNNAYDGNSRYEQFEEPFGLGLRLEVLNMPDGTISLMYRMSLNCRESSAMLRL